MASKSIGCVACKSCVKLDGEFWCFKACRGNGTIPATTGPRKLVVDDNGRISGEICPYTSDGWGTQLYEHPHPMGQTCEGCIENVASDGPTLYSVNCRNSVIFPLKGDDRECPFKRTSYDSIASAARPPADGVTCTMKMAEIICAGINDHDFTFWNTDYMTYRVFATLGNKPASWGMCRGFYVSFDWVNGVQLTLVRQSGSHSTDLATISGLTRADIDKDTLFITDGSNPRAWWGSPLRIAIVIDDPVDVSESSPEVANTCCARSQRSLSDWGVE